MPVSNPKTPAPGVVTRVAPRVEQLLAPNAGAWTFEGTNTWLVGEPGGSACAVVDPGPESAEHLEAILSAVGDRTVTEILLTHGHNDHADGGRDLAARTGATVLAQRSVKGRRAIGDGQFLNLAGQVRATVRLTPGHTTDSLCIELPNDNVVFTGDTLLGSGSPVVHPALMAEMLSSLQVLADLGAEDVTLGLPGHGPVIANLTVGAERRIAARERRIAQVAELRRRGTTTVADLVAEMYRHIDDPDVLRAAHSSVEAMVGYLDNRQESVGSVEGLEV